MNFTKILINFIDILKTKLVGNFYLNSRFIIFFQIISVITFFRNKFEKKNKYNKYIYKKIIKTNIVIQFFFLD